MTTRMKITGRLSAVHELVVRMIGTPDLRPSQRGRRRRTSRTCLCMFAGHSHAFSIIISVTYSILDDSDDETTGGKSALSDLDSNRGTPRPSRAAASSPSKRKRGGYGNTGDRDRSRSRSLTPPPVLSETQIANVKNIVRFVFSFLSVYLYFP
jgi:hypothetical protein